MALWAEWDSSTNNVVQVKNDDQQPGQLVGGFTGADRTTGAKTTWYPLEVEYPEEYVPKFPQLLGAATMTLENYVVYQRFPKADFSETAVREALTNEVKQATRAALSSSDWYVVRHWETGEPIPDSVKEERIRTRALGQVRQQQIAEASPSDLLTFDTSVNVIASHVG